MQRLKLSLLILFFMQSVTAAPFSYLKPWTWMMSAATKKKLEEEKAQKLDRLNQLYTIKFEFDDIEKVYKKVTEPVTNEQFKDTAFINAMRKNAGIFGTIFLDAQRRWKLADSIYFGTSMNFFKEKILMAAIQKAEKEAQVSAKERPTSWYTQLKTAEKTYYCPGLYNGDKQAMFKEWQEEYEKSNPMAKDRNDFFEQWRLKNRKGNKPAYKILTK